MSLPTTQQTGLSLRALLALKTQPPPDACSLPAELWAVGEIDVLSERTSELHRVLEELSSEDLHLPALVAIWNAARHEDPIGQRLLSSLVEVRQSGLELLRQMIRPSQSIRCCLRWNRGAMRGPQAQSIARQAGDRMAQVGITVQSLEAGPGRVLGALHQRAQQHVEALLAGDIHASHLNWLRSLAETELEARALRLETVAEQVGAYDGRRISRVLPHLSREEERIRDTRAMMVQWPETDELQRRSPALMSFLEERAYWKLISALQETPGGRELAHVLQLLPKRVPVTRSLLFLASVLREMDMMTRGRSTHSLDAARCLMVALQIMQADGSVLLAVEKAEARRLKPLVERLSIETPRPDLMLLRYQESLHHQMLPADGIPVLVAPEDQATHDIRQLVIDNMQNEHILCGFLGSPRVAASPGLVELIVRRTRSIKILLDIANRRELYSGHANRNVPEALLEHPSNIPTSALRKFVHVRYIDRSLLNSMASRGTRVRPEVRNMAAVYLKTIGN